MYIIQEREIAFQTISCLDLLGRRFDGVMATSLPCTADCEPCSILPLHLVLRSGRRRARTEQKASQIVHSSSK